MSLESSCKDLIDVALAKGVIHEHGEVPVLANWLSDINTGQIINKMLLGGALPTIEQASAAFNCL